MTNRVPIATRDAQEILLSTFEWAAIVMAADDTSLPSDQRGLCITVRDTVRQSAAIRMDDPVIAARTEAALGALVGAGLLSEATRTALLALADGGGSAPPAPRVRLEKGLPVMNGTMLVLTTGDYELDALVELARPEAPHASYFAMPARVLVEASA